MTRWITTGRFGWPSRVDVLALHALGQHGEIDLDGGELPLAAQRVLHVDVDLGPVEGAAALIEVVGEAVRPHRLVERVLGGVPLLLGAELVGRPRGQPVRGREPEGAVPLADEVEEIR